MDKRRTGSSCPVMHKHTIPFVPDSILSKENSLSTGIFCYTYSDIFL